MTLLQPKENGELVHVLQRNKQITCAYRKIYYQGLGHAIIEAERSHDLYLQIGSPEKLVV